MRCPVKLSHGTPLASHSHPMLVVWSSVQLPACERPEGGLIPGGAWPGAGVVVTAGAPTTTARFAASPGTGELVCPLPTGASIHCVRLVGGGGSARRLCCGWEGS
jgi:hypothetical protein